MSKKKEKKGTEEDLDVDFVDPKQNHPDAQSPALKRNNGDDDEDTFKSTLSLDKRVSEAILENDSSKTTPIETKEPIVEEQAVSRRKFMNEDVTQPSWLKHHKHVFVLSSAGKPIYSRYGDEQNLAPFMASLVAMVSFVNDMDDDIRYLVAGKHKFVFLVKGPIILVCVARTGEPVSHLEMQLNYVHSQVISILTSGVNQIFERRAHFDLRSLLGGADKFLDSLMSLMDHDFSFLLNSVHCLRLPSVLKQNIVSVIQSAKRPELLYAILMVKQKLVTLVRPKKYVLTPPDIHLITNFVNSSTAFRASESWTPLCLPNFNDQGFLHAYVTYISDEVCLLLLSTKPDCFYELSSSKTLIAQGMKKIGALEALTKCAQNPYYDYSVEEVGIPGLLHFIYKMDAVSQFTCPDFGPPYSNRHEKKRLFRLYQHVHKQVHRFKKAHKVYYQASKTETLVGWATTGFELYAVFGPLESKASCIKACNSILKWLQSEEDNLFIVNPSIW